MVHAAAAAVVMLHGAREGVGQVIGVTRKRDVVLGTCFCRCSHFCVMGVIQECPKPPPLLYPVHVSCMSCPDGGMHVVVVHMVYIVCKPVTGPPPPPQDAGLKSGNKNPMYVLYCTIQYVWPRALGEKGVCAGINVMRYSQLC